MKGWRSPFAICVLLLTVVSLGVTAALSIVGRLQIDEIEHVHAGWLVSQGLRPYQDFFEHHHPLLWYLIGLVLPWTSQTAGTLVVLRLSMLALLAATAWLTARLALRATGDRGTAALSALLLVSMSGFVRWGHHIRPDVPQMLSALLACLWLASAMESSRPWRMAAAGLSAGVAVAFSMKAGLLLLVWGATALLAWRRRRVRAAAVAVFVGACALPIGSLLGYWAWSGSFDEYYATNWAYNALVSSARRPIGTAERLLFVNAGFWVLAIAGGLHVLWVRRENDVLRLVAATGLGLVALFVATRRTDGRTALLALPYAAVTAAYGFEEVVNRWRLGAVARAGLLTALCLAPLIQTSSWLARTNTEQLAKIAFVLERTQPDDLVYDGGLEFNLFRRDADYFWFFPGSAQNARARDPESAAQDRAFLYARLSGSNAIARNPSTEDACAVVRAARPRIVSDFWLDLRQCGLADEYRPTLHAHVYERQR